MLFRVQLKLILTLLSLTTVLTVAWAESPEEKGLAIFQEADQRDQGFGDFTSIQTMVLRNQQGQESRRVMANQTLEGQNDGDKTLIIFREPKDVEGTALLTQAHLDKDDDQWLYLPALKRVKRISGASKSGSFMGSEFSFEDLAPQQIEDYVYRHLQDETLDGAATFVVERIPKDKDSGYARQMAWIDQDQYRLRKVVFYDRKNALLKTLTLGDYEQFLNRYWRSHTIKVTNHQTGKSTDLLISEYRFKTGLGERDFDRSSLERAR